MKQITVNVPDHQYAFFVELVDNLGLEKAVEENVEVETLTEEEVVNDLAHAFKEVKLIEEGKVIAKPAREFLDEL